MRAFEPSQQFVETLSLKNMLYVRICFKLKLDAWYWSLGMSAIWHARIKIKGDGFISSKLFNISRTWASHVTVIWHWRYVEWLTKGNCVMGWYSQPLAHGLERLLPLTTVPFSISTRQVTGDRPSGFVEMSHMSGPPWRITWWNSKKKRALLDKNNN